jgi:hypothetical protein
MVTGRWTFLGVLLLLGSTLAFPGCAGKSTGQHNGGAGAAGGSGATGGSAVSGRGGGAGTGGSTTGGSGGTGGSGNRAGTSGTGGSAGTTPSSGDCLVAGEWVVNGTRWVEDCNTCWCENTKVQCTLVDCSGVGGSGGAGGSGAGRSGSGGEGGEPACEDATIGAFCVVGIPINSGDQIRAGMPLQLRLFPSGCHSSSCTTVVSASCNYISDQNNIWVSPFVCLREEGDACTDDCGGGATGCDAGVELKEGVTTVFIAGTNLSATFTVPSVAMGDELCSGEVQ